MWLWPACAQGAVPELKRICASKTGVNTISWYPFSDTCSKVNNIIIFGRETDLSPWVKIDSIAHDTSEYVHATATKFLRGSYFIVYNVQCAAGTQLKFSDTLHVDITAPDIIQPDSISVQLNGRVVIGWTPPIQTDVKSYVIYRSSSGFNVPVDTVYGKFNTSFIDSFGGDPKKGAEQYKIAVVDSCENITPISSYHQTIFLSVNQDSCAREIYLDWSSYFGWPSVVKYEVYMAEGASPDFKMIDETTAGDYTFRNGRNGETYSFFVRAVNGVNESFTSTSNIVSHKAAFTVDLAYLYLTKITTEDSGIVVSWAVPHPRGVSYFKLFKGRAPARLKEIAQVSSGRIQRQYFFTDKYSSSTTVWYYLVEAYSSCGTLIATSNMSNNIVLQLELTDSGRYLVWNDYTSWEGGIRSYDLHRNATTVLKNHWHLVTTQPTNAGYLDKQQIDDYGFDGLCYYITAIEGTTNKYGFEEVSHSNKVCYADYPIVHVPNVFVPGGLVDTVFKPITLFADTRGSTMAIYNRWGERIFSTDDIDVGWDGILAGGQPAPVGVYYYEIVIRGIDKSTQTLRGILNLL